MPLPSNPAARGLPARFPEARQERDAFSLVDEPDVIEVPVAVLPGPVLPTASQPIGVTVIDEVDEFTTDDLLTSMLELKSSDLHLSHGLPPMVRIHGEVEPLAGYPRLSKEDIDRLAKSIMSTPQQNTYEANWELDFAYDLAGRSRFRVNVMRQRGSIAMVMRAIPWEIKSIEELNLPGVINEFAGLPRGLVLVTGPTGSGKSTTLAAIIDQANKERRGHIVTVEDPIEFVHSHKNCVVNQREVGEDTKSYAAALKHVLRQDPDIILVGEMRDLETISVALTAAETGHLVFATLHTQSAKDTISRIIDVFPENSKEQVRQQLASTIQGIICQTLVKTYDGDSRVAAVEVMKGTAAIRNLIREKKEAQIPSALQTGGRENMQTMDAHLKSLVENGVVKYEDAAEKVSSLEQFWNELGKEEGIRNIERRRRHAQRNGLQG